MIKYIKIILLTSLLFQTSCFANNSSHIYKSKFKLGTLITKIKHVGEPVSSPKSIQMNIACKDNRTISFLEDQPICDFVKIKDKPIDDEIIIYLKDYNDETGKCDIDYSVKLPYKSSCR